MGHAYPILKHSKWQRFVCSQPTATPRADDSCGDEREGRDSPQWQHPEGQGQGSSVGAQAGHWEEQLCVWTVASSELLSLQSFLQILRTGTKY